MKKIIALLLTAVMLVGLVACASKTTDTPKEETTTESTETAKTEETATKEEPAAETETPETTEASSDHRPFDVHARVSVLCHDVRRFRGRM